MSIALNSKTNLVDIFKAYQEPGTLDFNKTEILVKLLKLHGEKLISRSQAKRMLRDLGSNFKVITLDFDGVSMIGQGFADEIFRVYKSQHPKIKFKYINSSKDVEFMIKRSIKL